MNKTTAVKVFEQLILPRQYHWRGYHFSLYQEGYEHFLAESIISSCLNVEKRIPGYTKFFAEKLGSFSDIDWYLPHYEQILQLLSELLVINHLCDRFPATAAFSHEPTAKKGGKNPELGIKNGKNEIFVEVKCREFINHHNNRSNAEVELPYRSIFSKTQAEQLKGEGTNFVLPRDNTIKDFLVSANEKFKDFKERDADAITVLIIVWDDFIYEPISALLNKETGLLTENSFYKTDGGDAQQYNYIDAIILIRHSHHLVNATRDQQAIEKISHPLEWGNIHDVLPKAYIPVNAPKEIDNYLCDIFQALHIDDLQIAADYNPQDIIFRL